MGGCSTAPNRWHPVGLSPGHPQAGQPRPCGRNMDGPPRPLSRLQIWGVSPPQACASPRSPGCRVQSTTSQMLVREPEVEGQEALAALHTLRPAPTPRLHAICSLLHKLERCAPFLSSARHLRSISDLGPDGLCAWEGFLVQAALQLHRGPSPLPRTQATEWCLCCSCLWARPPCTGPRVWHPTRGTADPFP